MKERATVANRAMAVVIVKTVVKKGEKVFNAYMILAPFVLFVVLAIGVWGCSLSTLLFSIVTNELYLIALWVHYRRKNKRCQVFFLNFFFVGCGVWSVGVWVCGCGCGAAG